MLGYSRDEFLGKKLWEIGAVRDVETSQIAFRELQQKGYIRYENLPLQTQDGRRIHVEFVSNVYQVDDTRVIQCNIRDISRRKERSEALTASLKERDVLLQEAHHRAKNNLQVISSLINIQVRRLEPGTTGKALEAC